MHKVFQPIAGKNIAMWENQTKILRKGRWGQRCHVVSKGVTCWRITGEPQPHGNTD